MNQRKKCRIPPSLAEFEDKIRATAKTAINLKLIPSDNLLPWQSKVGGKPYLPLSAEYPRQSITGQPLKLLTQINFAETPRLTGYPEKGILQFYIDPTEEFFGLGRELAPNEQKSFRVVYFEDVDEDISKLNTNDIFRVEDDTIINLEDGKKSEFIWPLNFDGQLSIRFKLFKQYMTSDDYRTCSEIFGCDPNQSRVKQMDSVEELFNEYAEYLSGYGHQIGGYPRFVMDDLDDSYVDLKGFELLFQLDSEVARPEEIEICWGDYGVASFFIRPQDLEKRDFSNVIFYRSTY